MKVTDFKEDEGLSSWHWQGINSLHLTFLLVWDILWLLIHFELGAFTTRCRTRRSWSWPLTCIPWSRV